MGRGGESGKGGERDREIMYALPLFAGEIITIREEHPSSHGSLEGRKLAPEGLSSSQL